MGSEAPTAVASRPVAPPRAGLHDPARHEVILASSAKQAEIEHYRGSTMRLLSCVTSAHTAAGGYHAADQPHCLLLADGDTMPTSTPSGSSKSSRSPLSSSASSLCATTGSK
jgi:hypothetical protein